MNVSSGQYLVAGNFITDLATGASLGFSAQDLKQRELVDAIDRLECRADDLCVTHLEFRGDARALHLINRHIAQVRQYRSGIVRVRFASLQHRLYRKSLNTSEPAGDILRAVHFVIPPEELLRWKAEHEVTSTRLQAQLESLRESAA